MPEPGQTFRSALLALTAVVTNLHPEGFKSAMETERAHGIWAMKTFQAATQQKTSRWGDLLDLFLARRFYKDEDFLLYLDRADFYFHALDQPFPSRLQRIAALERDIQKTKSRSVLNIASPHWAKAARSDAEIQTRLFVASVALAVERYRLGHDGRLPKALSDLFPDYLPAAPRDPFGTDLLGYKQLKSGFIVYSIGQDGHDDEGAEKPHQDPDATSYDLPLTIER